MVNVAIKFGLFESDLCKDDLHFNDALNELHAHVLFEIHESTLGFYTGAIHTGYNI